jgi:thiol-disulfide isomerase/thioredoxin
MTCCLGATLAVHADEYFPVLKAGSEVYTNVTVTSVTATDIYFSHARGLGNAKLKNLDSELRKHFKFDPAKALEKEKQEVAGNAHFRAELAARKTERQPTRDVVEEADNTPPKLYARSFLGQRPPQIIVDPWLTPPPDVNGKFVLVEFWATWSEPCLQAIPHLNDLCAKFKDRLIVIGLSSETEEEMRKMTSPRIDYSVGTDTRAQTANGVELKGIPHAILIDPQGIVRFEGLPGYLTERALARLLEQQAN